jgi:hypothetical protein
MVEQHCVNLNGSQPSPSPRSEPGPSFGAYKKTINFDFTEYKISQLAQFFSFILQQQLFIGLLSQLS